MSNKKPVLRAARPVPQSVPESNEPTDEPAAAVNRRPYIILLAVGLLILASSTTLAALHVHHMSSVEQSVFDAVNGVSLPHFATAQIASPISDAVWGILGLIVIFLLFPKFRVRAWQYAVAAGSAYVLAAIVEHIVNRGRPAMLTQDVVLRATQGGPGFPSGHVSVLAALCLTVWLFVSWPWRILLVMLVVAEAWSRIFLGVHSPLDVVGAVGVACVVVSCIHLAPQRFKRLFKLM